MKTVAAAVIVLASTLASGCTTYKWYHPTADQQQFRREAYECERDARQSGYYGGGLAGALNMRAFSERCMEAHGYEKRAAE